MKEFNIELAKAGHPVCTKIGLPARIICFDMEGNRPIVSLVKKDGIEIVHFHSKDGKNCDGFGDGFDLMMAPVKKSGYIHIHEMERFNNEKILVGERIYPTKEECMNDTDSPYTRIAIAKVEWEED